MKQRYTHLEKNCMHIYFSPRLSITDIGVSETFTPSDIKILQSQT